MLTCSWYYGGMNFILDLGLRARDDDDFATDRRKWGRLR